MTDTPTNRRIRCKLCPREVKAIGMADHMHDAHGIGPAKTGPKTQNRKATKAPQVHACEFPGCGASAKRIDIPTNWFRGDDVVLMACAEHRKPEHHAALLATDKAKRQMA